MVKEYVQQPNTIKDIFKDIKLTYKIKPVYRGLMNKITLIDPMIVSLLIFIKYLILRTIVALILQKDILKEKSFWITQPFYFLVMVILFVSGSFLMRYAFKLNEESIFKWIYLVNLIFYDCYVFMAFCIRSIKFEMIMRVIKFIVLSVALSLSMLKIIINYKPNTRKSKNDNLFVTALAVGMSGVFYMVLYFF